MALAATEIDAERSDLLEMLGKQRNFLRHTTQGLTDEQARARTTVSELTLGGLVKHVADVERSWVAFIVEGPSVPGDAFDMTEEDLARRRDEFRLLDGETLAGVLADYEAAAAATDDLVRTLPDLGATQPLPSAPWFPAQRQWSARRVLLHIIAETAQHCGHADIIRESIDGQKTMG
jgi:uncharacterized damage-inducible protein DinB